MLYQTNVSCWFRADLKHFNFFGPQMDRVTVGIRVGFGIGVEFWARVLVWVRVRLGLGLGLGWG